MCLAQGLSAFGQAAATAEGGGPYRQLAKGVMKEAQPAPEARETFSRHPVVELLAVAPDLDIAKNVVFRRDVWNLKFEFKPMRMIHVDLPASPDRLQRKLIWYLVYSVTNTGEIMHPVEGNDGTFAVQKVDKPITFVPRFVLAGPEYEKYYLDRVIPAALGPIRMREDPRREFFSSADVIEVQPGETKWGIATWEQIDPRLDRFSIYVGNLTNAYQWQDGPYKPGEPVGTGRRFAKKWLKLNFWRPGDEFFPHEREIRFGVPGEVDYEWVYR
jgi:hypothetical protein